MPLPSAGRPSAHARLVVILAGAAPARTATIPSFPAFAGAASGFAGRGRGYGKVGGGGGARLAVLGSYTALGRPISKNKASHFRTNGGGAVLCLARRADGEGSGAGSDSEGAGDGGDHHDAGKSCNFTEGKGTEGAPAVLCLAQRADGDMGGAGDGGDHNADETWNLTKGERTEGAPSGGDDDEAIDPGRSHLRFMKQLGWTIVQGLVTFLVFLLASALTYNSAYSFVYARIRAMILSYLSDEDIYAYAYTFVKKLLTGLLQDPEMTKEVQRSVIRLVKPSYPYDYIGGGTLVVYFC